MAGREELWEPELWEILNVSQSQNKGRDVGQGPAH